MLRRDKWPLDIGITYYVGTREFQGHLSCNLRFSKFYTTLFSILITRTLLNCCILISGLACR